MLSKFQAWELGSMQVLMFSLIYGPTIFGVSKAKAENLFKEFTSKGSERSWKNFGSRKGNALIGGKVDDICDGRVGDGAQMGGPGTDFFTINSSPDQFTESNPLEGDCIVDCESHEIIYFLI